MQSYHRIVEKIINKTPLFSFSDKFHKTSSKKNMTSLLGDGTLNSVSFDAFDTLITRPVFKPSDLFLLAGYRLKREGLIDCLPDAWMDLRRNAETLARRKAGDREVTLSDIYDCLERPTAAFDVDKAKAIEVDLEKTLIRPIASTIESFNALARTGQATVLSDIYLSQPDLTDMLSSCGVDCEKAHVFASSETGKTKRMGTLFDAASRAGTGRRVHVGDNMFADVWRARLAGCAPIAFLDALPNRLERLLGAASISPPILRSALAGSARTARLRVDAKNAHERGVAAISSGFSAPMLLPFVAWIIARAQALNIKRLYFFGRDGEILIEIARRIVAHMKLDLDLHYLYVSRHALHLPALVSVANQDFKTFKLSAGQSLTEVLSKFELADDERMIARLATLGFKSPRDAALSGADLEALLTLLRTDAEASSLLEARAKENRDLLIDYLRKENVLAPGNIGVVDIGWRGNLQSSLCKAVGTVEPGIADRMSGFYYGLYARPAKSGRFEAFIDQPQAAPLRSLVRGSMFEAICAARHGTTLRYAKTPEGGVTPVLAATDNPEAEAWGLAVQQQAITMFTDDLLSVLDQAGIQIMDHMPALIDASIVVSRAAIGLPTGLEARSLGSFPHAADQMHNSFDEIAAALPWNPAEWLRRYRHRAHTPMISYWPEASIVRTFPTPIAHGVLRGLAHMRAEIERRRLARDLAQNKTAALPKRPVDGAPAM